jgi:hypothetical protein
VVEAKEFERQISCWLRRADRKHAVQAENLALRRDAVTVLRYVSDHKVVGTQSTGNFSLKVVREVTARFVEPPVLDTIIGDHTYRLRSEDDVWPLVLIHTLLYDGELLSLDPPHRWQVTEFGERFLASSPVFQVWMLSATWWYWSEWHIAYPIAGLGEGPPPGFKRATLDHLLALPVERPVPFVAFTDRLIEKTGLEWTSENKTYHQMLLRGAVERIVVRLLATFEVLEPRYEKIPGSTRTYPELVEFQVTRFGRDMLECLAS